MIFTRQHIEMVEKNFSTLMILPFFKFFISVIFKKLVINIRSTENKICFLSLPNAYLIYTTN